MLQQYIAMAWGGAMALASLLSALVMPASMVLFRSALTGALFWS